MYKILFPIFLLFLIQSCSNESIDFNVNENCDFNYKVGWEIDLETGDSTLDEVEKYCSESDYMWEAVFSVDGKEVKWINKFFGKKLNYQISLQNNLPIIIEYFELDEFGNEVEHHSILPTKNVHRKLFYDNEYNSNNQIVSQVKYDLLGKIREQKEFIYKDKKLITIKEDSRETHYEYMDDSNLIIKESEKMKFTCYEREYEYINNILVTETEYFIMNDRRNVQESINYQYNSEFEIIKEERTSPARVKTIIYHYYTEIEFMELNIEL